MTNGRFLKDIAGMMAGSFPLNQDMQDGWGLPPRSNATSEWDADKYTALAELPFKPRSTPSTEKEEVKEQSEEDFIPTISW